MNYHRLKYISVKLGHHFQNFLNDLLSYKSTPIEFKLLQQNYKLWPLSLWVFLRLIIKSREIWLGQNIWKKFQLWLSVKLSARWNEIMFPDLNIKLLIAPGSWNWLNTMIWKKKINEDYLVTNVKLTNTVTRMTARKNHVDFPNRNNNDVFGSTLDQNSVFTRCVSQNFL